MGGEPLAAGELNWSFCQGGNHISLAACAPVWDRQRRPSVIGFLFAPVVDIKFRRRTWLVLASFGTVLSACLYFPLIGASHLVLMTALILAGGLITFLVAAACGGLIVKTLSESAQSKAAAWIMAGQLGGCALRAALILWLAARVPIATIGVCVAAHPSLRNERVHGLLWMGQAWIDLPDSQADFAVGAGNTISFPRSTTALCLSLVIIQNAANSPQVKVTETRVADLYRRVGRDCVSKC